MFSRVCAKADQNRLPVVLVHGLSMSSLYMAPTARRLAERYRVYAPDLPGYGRSQKIGRSLDLPELARWLIRWLDHYQVGPAVFVGNSMGFQTIVELALQDPQRVLKAVFIGPSFDPTARSYFGTIKRGFIQLLFEPSSFYVIALRDYLAHGIYQTMRTMGFGLRDPIEHKLTQVRAPALVVRGSWDKIVSAAWAAEVARLLPDARLVTIPRGGHVVNYDSPAPLVRAVEAFIEG